MKSKKLVGIITSGFLLLTFAAGCRTVPKDAVVINRDFLKPLHDAPTLDAWDANIYALQYMVEIEDPYAVETAWLVLPVVLQSDVVYKESDWLALALYDASLDGEDIRGLEILTLKDQLIVIEEFDKLQPVDWATIRPAYLAQHPDVAKALSDQGNLFDQSPQVQTPATLQSISPTTAPNK